MQDLRHPALDPLGRSEQGCRVQVSLDPHLVAQPLPRLAEVYAPVDPDDISAGCVHLFKNAGCSGGKVDGGDLGG